ncbi:MAG: CHRD domain-containing protein [Nocardioidaceae bacterium]|nr:CHRD domain-containing protein [Nocardioidaceae bacterium]
MNGKQAKLGLVASVLAVGGLTASSAGAHGDEGGGSSTRLTGYEEVPAVSTTGRGHFRAWVNEGRNRITYSLSYRKMSSEVVAAHIHLGQRSVNGGVAAFLCSDEAAPGSPPTCPDRGVVRDTITPADVIGPEAQGIAPGEFDELVRAMRSGVTYVNVHSTTFPSGEIRGQIGNHDDDDHDDDDDD